MENSTGINQKWAEEMADVNYAPFSKENVIIDPEWELYLSPPPLFPVNPNFKSNEPLNIKTLSDLISVIKTGKGSQNYNWIKLLKALPALEKLETMIGMKILKSQIVKLAISCSSWETSLFEKRKNHHFVIYGGPGCGKTEASKILASLYYAFGIVPKDKISIVGREDIIAEYVGQSEVKTKKLLDASLGGVIVFEEIYSLTHKEGASDSFASSIINVINRFLSEREEEFVCGFIGHRDKMETLWKSEPGLRRRFSTFFDVEDYTEGDLYLIFRKMLPSQWKISDEQDKKIKSWFSSNFSKFSFFGGDVKNLVPEIEASSRNRRFGTDLPPEISIEDVIEASSQYFGNRKLNEENKIDHTSSYFM